MGGVLKTMVSVGQVDSANRGVGATRSSTPAWRPGGSEKPAWTRTGKDTDTARQDIGVARARIPDPVSTREDLAPLRHRSP